MKNKEQLQAELNALIKKETAEMIEREYPKFAAMVGKCFKYRNSYGRDSENWWSYSKITEINKKDVYDTHGNGITAHCKTLSFQITTDDRIEIYTDKFNYVHSLKQEITEGEFNTAWNKMIEKINSL